MVVGELVHHWVCLTAWLALVVNLSIGGCMCLCLPGACIWMGLPFWVGCDILAASVLVWDVFCCPTCLFVAGVRCRASGTGRSVGSVGSRDVGPCFWSVLTAWCLSLAFGLVDVPMPPPFVGT
ncbi:hypothetical protein CHARACLAT_026691 [Characodon lateralis]|uniref:Uncharacterized protein n=1 Tax=Characodon lateralis TaxID=208331 RepID=A0ABU7D493_9TELE|nr:hypothetical protein [Characodon lateralis]